MTRAFAVMLGFSLITLWGCAEVKPWQKGTLAKSHMAFEPDTVEQKYKQHVYFSKEGSAGGYGISAGGCGCN